VIALKAIRQQKGLSLRKLGDLADVHFVSLARIEAGMFDPRLSTLWKLAKALDVTVSELIGEQPPTKERRRYGTHQTKGRLVRRVSRR